LRQIQPEDVFGPSLGEFECQGQNLKVKINRDKNALCTHNSPASTEWNALAANNATQAADATIPSLPRGDISGLRALSLASYRWALPRSSRFSYLDRLSQRMAEKA